MAARKPLVIITGRKQELPAADVLAPASLGTGTPDVTVVLRGDSTWGTQWQFGDSAMFAHSMG